jgi:aspartate dehydrogenase
MKKLKLGIIGCGTIGTEIAVQVKKHLSNEMTVQAIYDTDQKAINKLKKRIRGVSPKKTAEEVFQACEIVAEAASSAIVKDMLCLAYKNSTDIMIMSVGGVLGNESILKKLDNKNIKVYMPSGALAGIDAIKAAGCANISSVTLVTKKPPKGLEGAFYIEKNKIDLKKIKKETVIFSGNVKEAIKGFPKNINVSAILSLAGIGVKRTFVKIVVVPGSSVNSHEIIAEGDFGKIISRTENVPSPANPKTSYLASLSAIATLRGIVKNVKIGT